MLGRWERRPQEVTPSREQLEDHTESESAIAAFLKAQLCRGRKYVGEAKKEMNPTILSGMCCTCYEEELCDIGEADHLGNPCLRKSEA